MITMMFFDAMTMHSPRRGHSRPFWTAFRQWIAARRQLDHVRELPDYLLDDVGLTRDQVGGARPTVLSVWYGG